MILQPVPSVALVDESLVGVGGVRAPEVSVAAAAALGAAVEVGTSTQAEEDANAAGSPRSLEDSASVAKSAKRAN